MVQWNLSIMKCQVTSKICSFSYVLQFTGVKKIVCYTKDFVIYKGLVYRGSTAVCNVCQPVLLIAMHSKGKGSPTLPPSSHLLQRDPYRYCLCQPVVKKDWNSCSWMGHLLILWCLLEWGIILILNTQEWQY